MPSNEPPSHPFWDSDMTNLHREETLVSLYTLDGFGHHIRASAGAPPDELTLNEAWRGARAGMRRLEEREAGCADQPALLSLPQSMAAHEQALMQCPAMNAAFARTPVSFALIEGDALMASRPSLWSDRLEHFKPQAQAAATDDGLLAQLCLPLAPALPTLHSHFDGETWTVNADDSALGWMNPGWHRDAHGRAVLQLVAGTPPSVVRAAYWNGRLLLIDGHHRVRMLRACGVNFVPCMVAACEDEADVLALAPHLRGQDLAPWFEAARPPMLRDHDRVSLVYRHQARRENRQVQVKITYRQA
jgi:hypothetical protein